MIFLSSMHTLLRALSPHLTQIIHIMQHLSILPSMERMVQEGEGEVGKKHIEMQMRILAAQTHDGKDMELTTPSIVATKEAWVDSSQGHIPWMDPTGQIGGEKMCVEVWTVPMTTGLEILSG